MMRLGLIKIVALALAVGVCLLIATATDRELASLDIRHPATLLSLVATRLHAVQSYAGKLINRFTAGFRETIGKHENPKKSLER